MLRVKVLDLDENQLSAWAEVQTLSQMPSLQRLSLTGNRIPDVAAPTGGSFMTSRVVKLLNV